MDLPWAAESQHPAWQELKAAIARLFAWAVPTEEAISCIRRYCSTVIEIGAGSGYWSWLMRQAGMDVAACDAAPPSFTWTPVERGDERTVDAYVVRDLVLCWPPWGTDMAFNALVRSACPHVVYVGEWMGGSANPRFFAELVARFEAIDAVAIPQWVGRSDQLLVFRRRRGQLEGFP